MGFLDFLFGKKETSFRTFEGTDMEYFDMLLENNLPCYDIDSMVYPRDIDVNAAFHCYPITFLLCRGGRPALAILLLSRSQAASTSVCATVESCANMGIPCLRFYSDEPNEKNQVLSAIRENLG